MADALADFKLGFRSLSRNRLVSSLAAASLALAIAGNTTVFSLVSALLIRPLPYADADRCVLLWQTNPENPQFDLMRVSPANFRDWQERARSFEAMAALRGEAITLTGGDEPEPVVAASVSPDLFRILGSPAALGRDFRPEEGERGRNRVAVLSHRFWSRRLGANRGIIDDSIELSGESVRVIGVMPEEFEFLDPRIEIWLPLALSPSELPRDVRELIVLARLRRDVPLERARSEFRAIARQLETEYPDENRGYGGRVLTMREQIAYGGNRELLFLLQLALVFVLLIACANVSNLLLARGQDRQREIALRTTLGASRSRIVRQLLVESLVLAGLGGVLGTLLGIAGVEVLASSFGPRMSRMFLPEMDVLVLAFTVTVATLAGLFFGLAPALQASRPELISALREGGRGAGIGSRRRLVSRALVVGEIALALVLLSGAAILIRGFRDTNRADPGFDIRNLLTLQLTLPAARYPEAGTLSDFSRVLVERIESLPGVTAAATTNHLPRSPFPPKGSFLIDGRGSDDDRPPLTATWLTVSPGYVETMRIPVLQGRPLSAADRIDGEPVVLVNEALARRHWGVESPLGARITIQGRSRRIVGVTGNVREDFLVDGEAGAESIGYLPQTQVPARALVLVLRTLPDPHTLAAPSQRALTGLDGKLSASRVETLEEFTSQFFVGMQVVGGLLTGFGALALVLAAVGIYGVIAFSVSRRTREIGIRKALGADRRSVLALVMREGLALTAAGFLVGGPGVFLASRGVGSLLVGLVPVAPGATAAAALTLVLVAAAACYLPARKAAGLPAVEALRRE